ncbi:MAG: NAD-dependent epimerase/dehydratase family protein [Chloroflexi bacterium]|nr:NAD-dependent epimerase/dehydratase family protein [Chloroflexota bacterium]
MRLPGSLPKRISFEVIERVVADIVLINMSIVTAFIARFIVFFYLNKRAIISVGPYASILDESVRDYQGSAWLVTLICLVAFALSGFYSYGRAYRGRYKVLVVFQAVSGAYLLFGFLTFFVPFLTHFPRSVLIASWFLTLAAVEAARLWAYLWKLTMRSETREVAARSKSIHHILAIGGAGYIGSILVRRLLERGYQVTVLDALIYGDDSIKDLYGTPRFEFIKGDLRDIECVVNAMQGIDAVVHLGALVGDPACAIDERLTLEINLAATRMIAEVAKGLGVERFIFASTCSVYGASDELLDEKSGLNPVSLYARSKIASEQVLMRMADREFAPTILRFATIFGLSPRQRFDLVVNLLAARAAAGEPVVIMGGQQWRPFIHVADAAEAITRCLEAPVSAVRGEILNVGSDRENYQIAQIGELIQQVIPTVTIVTKGEDPDQRNYRVSFQKFRERVNFVPAHTVRDSITELKTAVEQGLIGDYRDPKYSNYKTLADEGMADRIRREDDWSALYSPSQPEAGAMPFQTAPAPSPSMGGK